MNRRGLLCAGAVLGVMSAGVTGRVHAQVIDLNDAINKAGRQRMLSQRMAKSWMALGLGVLPELADKTMAASMALFDRQLVELKAFAPNADVKVTYQQLDSAWSDYKLALVGTKPGRTLADQVLRSAGQVLALAHQGTAQLEAVSNKPVGKLVNISGRQRMLSQRMAAFYLSASWGVQAAPSSAEMTKARDEFLAAHALLKAAPENTSSIRDELALAETQFAFFQSALGSLRPGTPDSTHMHDVFTTSERILQVMDKVTGLYSKLS